MESTTELIPAWYKLPEVGCSKCSLDHPGALVTRVGGSLRSVSCECLEAHEKAKVVGKLVGQTLFSERMWNEATKERCLQHIEDFETLFSADIHQALRDRSSVYLYGVMNSGKTLLTMYIARKFLEAGISTLIFPVGELLRRFKFFTSDISSKTYTDCLSVDVLVLDDLGTQVSTDFNDSSLFDIINGRYLRGLQTIVSGNLNPRDKTKINSEVVERIFSKILRDYKILSFNK